jgi:hypothetical protein
MELEKSRLASGPLVLKNTFVQYPDPPSGVPTYIRDWVFQYRRLREGWKHLEIYRSYFCHHWEVQA